MTPEHLAKEIHVLRDEENDSSDNGTYPWAGMPEGYRKNWTRVAQSLLDKYEIREKKAKILYCEDAKCTIGGRHKHLYHAQ